MGPEVDVAVKIFVGILKMFYHESLNGDEKHLQKFEEIAIKLKNIDKTIIDSTDEILREINIQGSKELNQKTMDSPRTSLP